VNKDVAQLEIVQLPGEVCRLSLRGRLDTPGVDAVETRVYAALSRGHGVVDLTGVTFLASLGIRMLITAAKSVHKRGARLVLVSPRGLVDDALRHSSIDDIIPVAPDLDAALALLGP
jgi:anti-sigma B factor antagonist